MIKVRLVTASCSELERHPSTVIEGRSVRPVLEQHLHDLCVTSTGGDLERGGLKRRRSSSLLDVCAAQKQLIRLFCPSLQRCKPERGSRNRHRCRHVLDSGLNSSLEKGGLRDLTQEGSM